MARTSDKLQGAVVGFGFIAEKGHLAAYRAREDVEIVAIADICEARRAIAGALEPKARLYESAESLLASERELDFVDIATPPVWHAAIALAALDRGCHVLCEKPLVTSPAEAKTLLEAAARKERVVFPCHNYKHAPVVRAIGEILESGEIGAARAAALNTFRVTHAKGAPEWLTDWRRLKRHSGGGITMDHGSHSFYLILDWMGGSPQSVVATMANHALEWDTEDNVTCVLKYPSGLVTAHLTWTAGVRKMMYTVQGDRGLIVVDDDELRVVPAHGPKRALSVPSAWHDASHQSWFNSMFDEFLSCVRRGDFVNEELRQAQECVRVISAAYESAAAAGREVRLAS